MRARLSSTFRVALYVILSVAATAVAAPAAVGWPGAEALHVPTSLFEPIVLVLSALVAFLWVRPKRHRPVVLNGESGETTDLLQPYRTGSGSSPSTIFRP